MFRLGFLSNVQLYFLKNKALKNYVWGPTVRGSIPFIHWGPRPEPRNVIVQIIKTSTKWPWDTAEDDSVLGMSEVP